MFLENLELSIDHMADKNPYIMVFRGDYNAKSNLWYPNDNTNIEGSKIDILTATILAKIYETNFSVSVK